MVKQLQIGGVVLALAGVVLMMIDGGSIWSGLCSFVGMLMVMPAYYESGGKFR